jgi:hypothetical protein
MPANDLAKLRPDDVVLDALPDSVLAGMEIRRAWFKRLPQSTGGLEFVVADLQRWAPGQAVRVAFLGGTATLHKDIADATTQITQSCNLKLDFGLDPQTGTYRTWSETDTTHAAEIRVSFDQGGYFSLVGTDSIDTGAGAPGGPVGGRPGQRSLNLGGFPMQRPQNWRGVVRHEFLHALGFHHEHQNMRGPCEADFRWDDDQGYEPTTDSDSRYVTDSVGRRPGIYSYLAGYPNFWTKPKIDFNLRTTDDPSAVASTFDRASVMLYRFPAIFHKNAASTCTPTGDGLELSEGDIRGLRLLYPTTGGGVASVIARSHNLLEAIEKTGPARRKGGLESMSVSIPGSEIARRATDILRQTLRHVR